MKGRKQKKAERKNLEKEGRGDEKRNKGRKKKMGRLAGGENSWQYFPAIFLPSLMH